jgi:hypothetical protein
MKLGYFILEPMKTNVLCLENARCSSSIFLSMMWLLKSSLNLKLSLLTFNLLVILKVTSQLGEH